MIFIISLWRVKSSFQTFSLLFQNLSLFHPRNPAKKIVSKIPSIFHQPFFKIQFHGPSSKFSHPRVQSHPRIIIRWRSLNNFDGRYYIVASTMNGLLPGSFNYAISVEFEREFETKRKQLPSPDIFPPPRIYKFVYLLSKLSILWKENFLKCPIKIKVKF